MFSSTVFYCSLFLLFRLSGSTITRSSIYSSKVRFALLYCCAILRENIFVDCLSVNVDVEVDVEIASICLGWRFLRCNYWEFCIASRVSANLMCSAVP